MHFGGVDRTLRYASRHDGRSGRDVTFENLVSPDVPALVGRHVLAEALDEPLCSSRFAILSIGGDPTHQGRRPCVSRYGGVPESRRVGWIVIPTALDALCTKRLSRPSSAALRDRSGQQTEPFEGHVRTIAAIASRQAQGVQQGLLLGT
jgi:hypothetical protein